MTVKIPHTLDPRSDDDDEPIIHVRPAAPESVAMVLAAPDRDGEGWERSNWLWFRLPTGDLIFGCYPQENLYMATEGDHSL